MKTIAIPLPELTPVEAELLGAGLEDSTKLIAMFIEKEIGAAQAFHMCVGVLAHIAMGTASSTAPPDPGKLRERLLTLYDVACRVVAATNEAVKQNDSTGDNKSN